MSCGSGFDSTIATGARGASAARGAVSGYAQAWWLDTLDLYSARSRRAFVQEAAAELALEPAIAKQELGRVLLALAAEQAAVRREAREREQPTVPEMTEDERQAAFAFLSDPRLLERILEDYEARGLVGVKGYQNQSAYSASKHALMGMTKALAREAQSLGIRVHAVCPGAWTRSCRQLAPGSERIGSHATRRNRGRSAVPGHSERQGGD